MKKCLAILLLTSYMLCAFGVNITFHHCGGKLKYVNILHSDKEKTCCKGRKMSKDCCKTVKVKFSKTDDNNQSLFSIGTKTLLKDASYYSLILRLNNYDRVHIIQDNYCLPPPPLGQSDLPIYIANSVFRI